MEQCKSERMVGQSCQKLLQSSSIKAHFDKERQKRNQHMVKLDDAKMHHQNTCISALQVRT